MTMADNLPAVKSEPSWSRELVKEIAMDVGKDVCAYLWVMYPEAVKATSSTFLLSLRNSIHNQIMAALDGPTDETSIRARIAERKTWRRKWKAQWKKIRAMPDLAKAAITNAEYKPPASFRPMSGTPKALTDAHSHIVLVALLSIARNTCCKPCREAALVAQGALKAIGYAP